ncbi:glycosyltransferase involved in cell wall biosynthesis [Azospirillum picis]|uniref:glycosyltransferase family 4 protein n=1 Tax=Azospirillum picis TaxID=488438 RepID=UPI001AE54ED7|nr:glycosyltransferase family 4 protein [Azospirillum picis]MBP2303072.1 glycosyltransferase involved in cell wall biosynthesis [Azospirillum picis]
MAVSGNLDYSGSSLALYRFLREVVTGGLAQPHEVEVLWGRLGPPALKDAYGTVGIPVILNAAPKAYDVVLCNSILTGSLVRRCADQCPVVWWIHEPRFGADMVRRGPDLPAAFTAATRIVFPTRWQATDIYSEWLAHENWVVVDNGVNVDLTPQLRPADLPPGCFTILQLGGVERRKGADVTLEAVRRLADPRVHLVYVGPRHPNFMPELTAEEAARIRFAGPKPETQVAAYLQHCDALSCPTRDDLVNLAILEALQSGLPVAASSFGAIPGTIRHDWNGLLSPVGDATALAANLARLRDDPALRRRLAINGQETHRERHTVARQRDALLTILEEASATARR